MELIRNYIYKQVSEQKLSPKEAEKLLKELMGKNKSIDDDYVAVIGMSGKFAGARNIDEFWDNIANKKICIAEYPEERIKDEEFLLDHPAFWEVLKGVPISRENVYYPKRGYLKDGLDKFDAEFFNISPREATYMNPDQRLFLETAWEAIEDAGYGGDKIYGTKTGVYVGHDTTTMCYYKNMTKMDPMHLTGSWASILASRVSYLYNLSGPSLVTDTACSSGLVAVHQACKALKNKDCDMAIVGGISLINDAAEAKSEIMLLDTSIVESPNQTVRPFDDNANGTLWGEGVGVVLLKSLEEALKDGDNIHAIIRGSAINNDGASNGLTAPDAEAQEEVIIAAWKEGGIDPETVSYVEAHGTATNLGDPIEVKGLTEAFRKYTDKKQFCALGSIKASIGHTVAASGIAALIKTILGMKNKKFPPMENFNKPNRYIDFCNSPLYVSDKLVDWVPNGEKRRAGVSSFGFSGTNCHVIVEEAPDKLPVINNDNRPNIFTLSAKNQDVLNNYIKKYTKFLNRDELNLNIEDVCYTVLTGRGHYSHRVAIVVNSIEDLKKKLEILDKNGLESVFEEGIYYGKFKLITGNRQALEDGDLTESEKWQLEDKVHEKLQKLNSELTNYSSILKELCELYIKGASIEWGNLYKNSQHFIVSLPVYPLERKRYWAPPKKFRTQDYLMKDDTDKIGHLLLDKCVVETKDQIIYQTDFTVNKWVLSDHKLLDSYLLPGVSYLEMARKASSKYYSGYNIELRDVVFMEPLIVEEGEVLSVLTIVTKKEDHLKFEIVSKVDNQSTKEDIWVTYAEGKVYKIDNKIDNVDVDKIFESCNLKELSLVFDQDIDFTFGGRWLTPLIVKLGENQSFVEIVTKKEFLADLDDAFLHPANLDKSMNSIMMLVNDTYLPFIYKSFKIYHQLPEKFYSHARMKGDLNSGAETISLDVTLVDENGKVLVEVENYTIKKVHKDQKRKFASLSGKGMVYGKILWKEEKTIPPVRNIEGSVLVLGSKMKIAEKIVKKLKARNINLIEVNQGDSFKKIDSTTYLIGSSIEDYEKLINDVKDSGITEILHCLTLREDNGLLDLEQLETFQTLGVYSLFNLTKALLDGKLKNKLNITIISENVDEITGNEKCLNPQNAALFGMGKVIEQEYPNLAVRCIDIDSDIEIDQLMEEFNSEILKYKVAYRKGRRYVEEFSGEELDKENLPEIQMKNEGAYIITGGTGGIGLAVAKYLATNANVNLVLINRTPMPGVEEWDSILEKGTDEKICRKIAGIREVEALGANVELMNADVSDIDQMRTVINSARKKYKKINGVIHSAGNAGDGYILNKTNDIFRNVILPKINGTWVLNDLTKEDKLDFFVLFSSIATLQISAGQSDYTAANSFLDSFAAYGRKNGVNTIVINWPGWSEVGMAVDYDAAGDDENLFYRLISTENALEAFDTILRLNEPRLIPGELNYKAIALQREQLYVDLSFEINKLVQIQTVKVNQDDKELNLKEVVLKGKSSGEYDDEEIRIGRVFASVLGLSEIDVYQTFNEMGGDSILATQLYKAMNEEFQGIIDITDIFTYPTVLDMTQHIKEIPGKEDAAANKSEDYDAQLEDMLDSLEKGELSIEEGLDSLD